MKRLIVAFVTLAMCTSAGVAAAAASKDDETKVPRITKEETVPLLDKPGVVLIDVRLQEQWEISDQKLPGAVHEDQGHVTAWAEKYSKNDTIILYCA